MTIHIPDDLARGLEGIAASQNRSVEELAVERLRLLVDCPESPADLLRALRALPRPSRAAVDDLDAAIAAGRLPLRSDSIFDT
jgi:hypothetical protein